MSPLRKAAVTVLFGLAAVLSFRPASGQVLPDKKVVQEWVSKARNSGGLQSPDDQPYHLVAKLRYTLADKTIEAMYEILWAAPDRYRVEFRGGESAKRT
jgi:hypothetical protein